MKKLSILAVAFAALAFAACGNNAGNNTNNAANNAANTNEPAKFELKSQGQSAAVALRYGLPLAVSSASPGGSYGVYYVFRSEIVSGRARDLARLHRSYGPSVLKKPVPSRGRINGFIDTGSDSNGRIGGIDYRVGFDLDYVVAYYLKRHFYLRMPAQLFGHAGFLCAYHVS